MKKLNILDFVDTKMLYDGDESEFYTFSFTVKIDSEEIKIKASDFYNNSLVKLKNDLSELEFREILDEGNFVRNDELVEKYLGTDLLPVYYCYKHLGNSEEKLLFTFSFAEIQPTRFRLYLEDIWKE